MITKRREKNKEWRKKKIYKRRVTCSIPDCAKPSSELEKRILFTKNALSLLVVSKNHLNQKHGLVHIFQNSISSQN